MPHRLRLVLGTLAVFAAVAAVVSPAKATTGASYTIDVPVQVRATQLTIKKNEYTKNGVVRYPRGTTVHFHVHNGTKHVIRPQLRVLTGLNFVGGSKLSKITKSPTTIAPGKTGNFNIYFFFRGTMLFQAVTSGKVVSSAHVAVF